MGAFPLESLLQKHFGFDAFRPGQRKLIESVLAGQDALGVLPTAGGKSLCYQLPALILPGLTLVVSPLIALMKDQVDAFNRRGRGAAVALHSNLSSAETSSTISKLHRGEAALLYVAPERFESAEFRARLLALQPRFLVIDEAHCVSMWGHDFRPSYLCLGEVAAAMRPCPVLALTATATPETRKDILARLGLQDPLVHVAPFDRPNLRFEVHQCGPMEKLIRLRRILKELSGLGSQIVYVGRRRDADEIAADLEADGFGAVAYHAGMDPTERKLAQEAWLAGRKPIAVATIAFGMGIDKPDVRAVIHYQHPASLESYYQEAGRAGRDGQPARCILLFSGKDSALAHFFIRNRYPTREQVLALAKDVPREGISAEHVREAGDPDMTDEQRNVALLALQEEKWLRREERSGYRRAEGYGRSLSLSRLFQRKDGDYRRLEAMVAYGNERTCHRSVLLGYFGEQLPAKFRCGNCSACEGGTARVGQEAAADEVERILRRRWDPLAAAGLIHKTGLARFLAGSSSKRLPARVRDLPEFGILARFPMRKLRQLADEALGRALADDHTGGTAGSGEEVTEAVPSGTEGVFWQSRDRAFTREELVSRSVPRQKGLHILALAQESGSGLSPSRMANVLRGSIGEAAGPDGRSFSRWKQLGSSSYPEVLEDVLAMWAKGYLAPAPGSRKKLVLSEKGRKVLEKTEA